MADVPLVRAQSYPQLAESMPERCKSVLSTPPGVEAEDGSKQRTRFAATRARMRPGLRVRVCPGRLLGRRQLEFGRSPVTAPNLPVCPKRMVFGPCGGVKTDRSCELGAFQCAFADLEDAVDWTGPAAVRPSPQGVLALDPSRPLVLSDMTLRPFDRRSIEQVTSIMAGSCDALLIGEHQSRPDFPPAQLVSFVKEAGGRAVVTLTCRDRNRVVLEQELAGLAELGAAGVLCVTGDGRAPGVRPEVTQVFDLDGTRLAAMAFEAGLPVLVPESPDAAPVALRPGRLLQKQRAGAGLCVLNHTGSVDAVDRFVRAARSLGVTVPIVAAVSVYTDQLSADVLRAFPGLHLQDEAVAAVLDAADPVSAGIDAAVAEARALLAIDGVVGVNVSGLASGRGVEAGAEVKAAVGLGIRGVRR